MIKDVQLAARLPRPCSPLSSLRYETRFATYAAPEDYFSHYNIDCSIRRLVDELVRTSLYVDHRTKKRGGIPAPLLPVTCS